MPCAHEHDSRCYIEAEHCTHEHTEECYSDEEDGDYDIMATPSNLGKATSSNAQERNAEYCYHICDEYSGCISEKQLEKTGENQWVVFLPYKSRTYVFTVSYAGNQYYQAAKGSCQVVVARRSSDSSGSDSSASGNTPALPDYVVKGTWTQLSGGGWGFSGSDGILYRNTWVAAYNPYADTALGQSPFDWFYFDGEGCMVTGWLDESGYRFYLNPMSDGSRGKMLTGWQQIEGRKKTDVESIMM